MPQTGYKCNIRTAQLTSYAWHRYAFHFAVRSLRFFAVCGQQTPLVRDASQSTDFRFWPVQFSPDLLSQGIWMKRWWVLQGGIVESTVDVNWNVTICLLTVILKVARGHKVVTFGFLPSEGSEYVQIILNACMYQRTLYSSFSVVCYTLIRYFHFCTVTTVKYHPGKRPIHPQWVHLTLLDWPFDFFASFTGSFWLLLLWYC